MNCEYVVEFLLDQQSIFFQIFTNRYGEIEQYVRLQKAPDFKKENYKPYHNQRIQEKIYNDAILYGMFPSKIYKKNQNCDESGVMLNVLIR